MEIDSTYTHMRISGTCVGFMVEIKIKSFKRHDRGII